MLMHDLFPVEPVELTLRDYQDSAVRTMRTHIASGIRRMLLDSATGSGKTAMAAWLIQRALAKGKKVLFVVDMIALINQTSATFDTYGLDHGIVQAKHPRCRPYLNLQICSIQTIKSRGWPDEKEGQRIADMVFCDEAHVVHRSMVERIERANERGDKTIFIGLSATPFTDGLAKLYSTVVHTATTDELIAAGHLAGYRMFTPSAPDMAGVKINKRTGEYDENEGTERVIPLVGDVVTQYIKHGQPLEFNKFICGAFDTKHVDELIRQFGTAGIRAEPYTYHQQDTEREDTIAEFRKPDSSIRGLITVNAATRGFDVPDLGVVISARPYVQAVGELAQLIGRGLRSHPLKEFCLIADHAGNIEKHGEFLMSFYKHGSPALDDGTRRPGERPALPELNQEDKLRTCPMCKHAHKWSRDCPNCGHQYRLADTVKAAPGELVETIVNIGGERVAEDYWAQICTAARKQARGDTDRACSIAHALHREIFGRAAPRDRDFYDVDPVEVGAWIDGQITSKRIAYRAAQKKKAMQELRA